MRVLTFEKLESLPLAHAVSTRAGGVSGGPFASMNLGDGVGDDEDAVAENRKRLLEHCSADSLVWATQVHGCEVVEVGDVPASPPSCDALISNVSGLALMIKHADCQAAIIYDPVRHALGLVHSGWRGSVQNIYGKTIERMHTCYGSIPSDLIVCIGPSLGPEAAEFVNFRDELPEELWRFQRKPNYFDFWAISQAQLTEARVRPENIEFSHLCTFSDPKAFFSYRRDRVTGRMGTVAALS